MRCVYLFLAIGAVVAMAGLFGGGGSISLAQQEEAPPPTRLPDFAAHTPFQYQGVASCASVACHHGNGPKGTQGSEYTTWIAHNDPHSRAYRVLFDRRSLLIEKNLKSEVQPHKDTLCLSCHVNPDVETADHADRFSRTDGVGCESCHGAAEKWLSVHHTDAWKQMTPAQKQREGMTNTKDVRVRAQVCVRCHVGWEKADVNHDLIAAGHPRLRFEYGAYLANYTARHWKIDDDHARYRDFEARAWLVGQAVSAKAALDLLKYRADTKHGKPWPEFAEYGCFGCHHELRDQESRRKGNAGQLPWGTWYFSQRRLMADTLHAARRGDRDPFEALAATMAKNFPNQTKVVGEAATAARVLERWTTAIDRERWDKKALERLLAALAKDNADAAQSDWEGAAQRYLGIAAVYNSLSDMDNGYKTDGEMKSILHHLANKLIDAVPKEPGVKFDSPRGFEPDMLQQDLRQLRERLQWHGKN